MLRFAFNFYSTILTTFCRLMRSHFSATSSTYISRVTDYTQSASQLSGTKLLLKIRITLTETTRFEMARWNTCSCRSEGWSSGNEEQFVMQTECLVLNAEYHRSASMCFIWVFIWAPLSIVFIKNQSPERSVAIQSLSIDSYERNIFIAR